MKHDEILKNLVKNQLFDELIGYLGRFMEDNLLYQNTLLPFHLRREPLFGSRLKAEMESYEAAIRTNQILLQDLDKTILAIQSHTDLTTIPQDDLAKLPFPIPPELMNARNSHVTAFKVDRDRIQKVIDVLETAHTDAQSKWQAIQDYDSALEAHLQEEQKKASELEEKVDATAQSTKEFSEESASQLQEYENDRRLLLEEIQHVKPRADGGDEVMNKIQQNKLAELDQAIAELTALKEEWTLKQKASESDMHSDSMDIRKKLQQQYPSDFRLFTRWYHYRSGMGGGRGANSVLSGMLVNYLCDLHTAMKEDTSITKVQINLTLALYDFFMYLNKACANMHKIHDIKAGRDNVANIDDPQARMVTFLNSEKPNDNFSDKDNIKEKILSHQREIGGDNEGDVGMVGQIKILVEFLENHFNLKSKGKALSFLSRSQDRTEVQRRAIPYIKIFKEYIGKFEEHLRFAKALTVEDMQAYFDYEANKPRRTSVTTSPSWTPERHNSLEISALQMEPLPEDDDDGPRLSSSGSSNSSSSSPSSSPVNRSITAQKETNSPRIH